MLGLGSATRIGIYDLLGYYDICYLGDEVQNPGRTIPRSILISLVVVAAIYLGINLSINGVIFWREFVPAEKHPEIANYIGSVFVERLWGRTAAEGFTLLVVWTGLGSVFALLLGYSRIPFAAAKDGTFFRIFGRVHPRGHFPHVALVVIGLLAIAASFASLGLVIDALIGARILIQFIGQIAALWLLRKHRPMLDRPYRVWLYPLPLLIAGVGWLLVFATTPPKVIAFALGALALGVLGYGGWAKVTRKWPFEQPAERPLDGA